MYGYAENKDAVLARLKRVEGQVRGLQRMVEDDTYCIDILTQIAAVNGALKKVAVGLLHDHMNHCVTAAIVADGDKAGAVVAEATSAVERLLKS